MFRRVIGKIWKLLPSAARAGIVRLTQKKFTVSAAAIIINDRREVLLLNHVFRPRSGWGLPGGFVDHGEQIEEAVRREILEETGLEMDDLRIFRLRTFNRHIEIMFIAKPIGIPEVKSREIYELGWFGISDLSPGISRDHNTIIRQILNSEV